MFKDFFVTANNFIYSKNARVSLVKSESVVNFESKLRPTANFDKKH